MFHTGLVFSARHAAVVEDAIRFMNESELAKRHCHAGFVRFQDAALLVAQVRGCESGEPYSSGDVRALRYSIKNYVTSDEVLKQRANDDRFELVVLRNVIGHFCGVEITTADIDHIKTHVEKPPVGTTPRKRRMATKSSESTPSTSPTALVLGHSEGVAHQAVVGVQKYAQFSESELRVAIVAKDQELDLLKQERQSLSKSRLYYQNRCGALQLQLGQAQSEMRDLVSRVNYRPGLRNISRYGGYNLALKRALGHASAEATILMVAGSYEAGAFSSKKIVTKYEVRACVAQRISSRCDYREMMTIATDSSCDSTLEVVSYEGDATNQEAIGKHKIHVAIITSLATTLGPLEDEQQTMSTRSLCDLQVVDTGTSQETYVIKLAEFVSVGAPSWEQRVIDAASTPRRFTIFQFTLDAGPDNVGSVRMIKGPPHQGQTLKRVDNLIVLRFVFVRSSLCCVHRFSSL